MGKNVKLSASIGIPRAARDGADGKSAIEIEVQGAPLVFDTDENGVVPNNSVKLAKVLVRKGDVDVVAKLKDKDYGIAEYSELMNAKGADAAIKTDLGVGNYIEVKMTGSQIISDSYTDIGGNPTTISRSCGYVVLWLNYEGVTYRKQIEFAVNVAKFSKDVISKQNEQTIKLREISNKYDNLPAEVRDKNSFTIYNSEMKQTAREISLSVTEEAAKKRNLLVNSDFARNGGFYIYLNSYATIERIDRHNDENTFYTYPLNQGVYSKLTWEGSKANEIDRGSKNIPIVVGKKYTLSCWAKVSDTSAHLTLQVFGQSALTGISATATKGDMLNQEVTLDSANVWQLISYTFEAKGDYSYCSVRLFFRPSSTTRIKGYISQPMLEQAEGFNGWSLAEEDYVYRNGNLLDNTRYLNTGGNLTSVGTIINNAKDNCSMSEASVTTANKTATLLQCKLPLEAHIDYVLSFYIRSKDLESKQNVICTLNLNSGVFFAENGMLTEKESVGSISNYISIHGNTPTSGYIQFSSIPTEWTKVYYHFSLNAKNTAQPISILAYAQNGVGSLQICQPKLEKAVTNTAWTEAKQDVAFKDKYKRAGIDLDSETIRLSAERTIIDGDLHLKGILVENTAEPVVTDLFPIVCDLKQNKSIAVGTYTGNENYTTGSTKQFVLLPMVYDVPCINVNGNETTVAGLKESGVKLTIFSKYNPMVAKWANAKRMRYRDSEKNNNNVWGGKEPYVILHDAITVVYADPRIAFLKNYTGSGTIYPASNGSPSYKDENNAGYKHGCFVCNGRRGRFLLLMPGQALHLTSSIERWGNEDVLMWYVDNASEFVPISKNVRFYDSNYNPDLEDSVKYQYEWDNVGYSPNHDSSFPGDTLSALDNYVYEDVLFAPPQLSNDYPANDNLGYEIVKSEVPLVIPLF